jgi:hypothetical protein
LKAREDHQRVTIQGLQSGPGFETVMLGAGGVITPCHKSLRGREPFVTIALIFVMVAKKP